MARKKKTSTTAKKPDADTNTDVNTSQDTVDSAAEAISESPDATGADTVQAESQFEGRDAPAPSDEPSDTTHESEPASDSASEDAPAIEDAEIVDETAPDTDDTATEPAADTDQGTLESSAETPDISEDTAAENETTDVDTTEAAAEEAPAPAEPQVIRETVVEKKGGTVPMVLGGIIAAGLGYGVSQFSVPDETGPVFDPAVIETLTSTIDAQSTSLGALSDKVDTLSNAPVPEAPEAPDLSGIEAKIEGAIAAIADVSSELDAATTRIEALEARPIADTEGVVIPPPPPPVDLSGIEGDIEDLKAALDLQKGELAQMISEAQAEKDRAAAIARAAKAQSAITRVIVATDNGEAYADALAEFTSNSDLPVSDALQSAAAEGLPTAAEIRDMFPDAARAALAAVRDTTPTSGVGGFFAKQLGVRSVAPREGDDPDAILSRVDASVKDGMLEEALNEYEALPDAAKAPLADWASAATLRLTAARDAQGLATSLNSQ